MSKKLFRLFYLIDCIPLQPYKLTSQQIKERLVCYNVHVSLRTIQRDLEEISRIGLFGVVCDQRSRPHGWSRLLQNRNVNAIDGSLSVALSIALLTWKKYSSHLLPLSVLADLEKLFSDAKAMLSHDQLLTTKLEKNNQLTHQSYMKNNECLLKYQVIRSARWLSRLLRAEINFSSNKNPSWALCVRITPLRIIELQKDSILICNILDLGEGVYAIPFQRLRSLFVSQEASGLKRLNHQLGHLKCEENCIGCKIICLYKNPINNKFQQEHIIGI